MIKKKYNLYTFLKAVTPHGLSGCSGSPLITSRPAGSDCTRTCSLIAEEHGKNYNVLKAGRESGAPSAIFIKGRAFPILLHLHHFTTFMHNHILPKRVQKFRVQQFGHLSRAEFQLIKSLLWQPKRLPMLGKVCYTGKLAYFASTEKKINFL